MTDSINDICLLYRSPETKVVFVKVQGIICSSPTGEKNATVMEAGDDNW